MLMTIRTLSFYSILFRHHQPGQPEAMPPHSAATRLRLECGWRVT